MVRPQSAQSASLGPTPERSNQSDRATVSYPAHMRWWAFGYKKVHIVKINDVSVSFMTGNVEGTRDFYVKYLNAKVTFDCGWYVNLEFGNPNSSLQFMSPRQAHHKLSSGDGIIYNFKVDNVNEVHTRFVREGLKVVVPLEDHPWGDRGFGIKDPNGITLYLYEDREPSSEFQQYYID